MELVIVLHFGHTVNMTLSLLTPWKIQIYIQCKAQIDINSLT